MTGKLTSNISSWRQFKESKPGRRFRDRYHRRQRSRGGGFGWGRVVYVIVGLIIMVFSAFFGWLPGPGWVTFFVGLGMIAGEFRPAARFLDWAEVEGRRAGRPIKKRWDRTDPRIKTAITILAPIAMLALAYGVYRLFTGS